MEDVGGVALRAVTTSSKIWPLWELWEFFHFGPTGLEPCGRPEARDTKGGNDVASRWVEKKSTNWFGMEGEGTNEKRKKFRRCFSAAQKVLFPSSLVLGRYKRNESITKLPLFQHFSVTLDMNFRRRLGT